MIPGSWAVGTLRIPFPEFRVCMGRMGMGLQPVATEFGMQRGVVL